MTDPNVIEPQWDRERAPGIRSLALGRHAGAEHLGATLFELAPGDVAVPYHLHHANEELLIVLSGTVRLRTPEGVRVLEPGAVVSFPAGPAGAHRVSNAGDDPARFVIASTMRFPEVAEYPDIGATMAVTATGEGKAYRAGVETPYGDLMREGVAAGAEADRAG